METFKSITHSVARATCAVFILCSFALPSHAAVIDVLWYGHNSSTATGNYNSTITSLATSAGTYDPDGDGSNTWNLTIWNDSDPTPVFSNYDAFVIGSGFTRFFPDFDPTRLLAAKTDIEAARGSRTFISGQDADWHNANNLPNTDNGPRGFLINAVNWAASGAGLGIVALTDGYLSDTPSWIENPDSFLAAELGGHISYFNDEDVIIPPATANFPVNEGLTTAGLSNWFNSAHMCIDKSVPDYLSINDSGKSADCAITLVTESEAGGGTTPVPEPSVMALFGAGLLGMGMIRRRRK